jgi:predicted transcriptional regulator
VDLKRLLMQKGLKQIEVAKQIGANYSMVSMQVNKHRLLPEKYRAQFCSILGITLQDLTECMKSEGGKV